MITSMIVLTSTIIDVSSMILLLLSTAGLFYILVKYFKGMKKPPFWIYLIGGFMIMTFHTILIAYYPDILKPLITASIRFVASLFFLIGILILLRSYRTKIKFDKK